MQDLQDLFDDNVTWQWETFGPGYNPLPSLHHLKKEVQEAIDEPHNLEEYADIFLMTLAAVDRAGFDLPDLLKAAKDKFIICKQRKWGPPDENGVCEHIRE